MYRVIVYGDGFLCKCLLDLKCNEEEVELLFVADNISKLH